MRPIFTILTDSKDVTAAFADRLLQLKVTDEAGWRADKVSISVDNRNGVVAAPRTGAELEVSLGYKDSGAVSMGLYTVDGVSENGWPLTLVIQAKAADMRSSLKVQRTKSWDEVTLGDIVTTIASSHGLTARISPELASIALPHVDQTNESDLHFLTRLAKEYDAVARPANGAMLFVPRGEAKSVTGKSMPAVAISAKDILNFEAHAEGRAKYLSVKTYWHDPDAAERKEEAAGDGEPSFRLPGASPTQGEAQAAAKAKLTALERGTGTLQLTVVGNPFLAAECMLTVSGVSALVNGEWVVSQAVHTLNGDGYRTEITAATPKGKAKGIV